MTPSEREIATIMATIGVAWTPDRYALIKTIIGTIGMERAIAAAESEIVRNAPPAHALVRYCYAAWRVMGEGK